MDSRAKVAQEIEHSIVEITDAVRRCSRLALKWFRRPLNVENKAGAGSFDPVTEADRHIEAELSAFLTSRFPDFGVFGEEEGSSGPQDVRWVLDPIDGTRAFVTGRPMWGTLVGLEVEGQPVAGIMHIPTLDETYVGVGAVKTFDSPSGSSSLATSSTTDVSQAFLAATSPSMFSTQLEQKRFDRVASRCQLVRFDGDCVNYGLLATGDLDLVIENRLKPYDISPLIPIIEGAGGVVTTVDGQPASSGGFIVASANEQLHRQVLKDMEIE